MMNKKGDERLLSLWMFGIWILVAVLIISGVYLFYNVDADLRTAQSRVLNGKIAACLINDNSLNPVFFDKDINYYNLCSLNAQSFNDKKFYLRVSLYDNNFAKVGEEIILGDWDSPKHFQ